MTEASTHEQIISGKGESAHNGIRSWIPVGRKTRYGVQGGQVSPAHSASAEHRAASIDPSAAHSERRDRSRGGEVPIQERAIAQIKSCKSDALLSFNAGKYTTHVESMVCVHHGIDVAIDARIERRRSAR